MALVRIDGNKPPQPRRPEKCANCGTVIGRLETPHLVDDQIVCIACHRRLTVPVAQAVVVPTVVQSNAVHCPRCGSADTASLRTIYERGTSHTSGGMIGFAGDSMLFGGTDSTTMSRAAQRAAPPRQRESLAHAFGIFISIALILGGAYMVSQGFSKPAYYNPQVRYDDDGKGNVAAIGFVLAGGGIIWLSIAIFCLHRIGKWNSTELPILSRRWARSWMCQRCSTIFAP
jgi:hypothetical protein